MVSYKNEVFVEKVVQKLANMVWENGGKMVGKFYTFLRNCEFSTKKGVWWKSYTLDLHIDLHEFLEKFFPVIWMVLHSFHKAYYYYY